MLNEVLFVVELIAGIKTFKTEYTWHFSVIQYERIEWLTGCEVRSKFFCWPCLLFSREICV